jgi:hypothetical protein
MTTKSVRKSPRSKNAARVDRQLDAIKAAKNAAPKKGETVLHFDTVTGAHVKAAMVEAKKKSKPADVQKAIKKLRESAPKTPRYVQGSPAIKKAVAELNATGKTSLPAPKTVELLRPTATRGELGKVRRAHRRAFNVEPTDAQLESFASDLLKAGVDIMKLTSRRISKVLTGDLKIEELK